MRCLEFYSAFQRSESPSSKLKPYVTPTRPARSMGGFEVQIYLSRRPTLLCDTSVTNPSLTQFALAVYSVLRIRKAIFLPVAKVHTSCS